MIDIARPAQSPVLREVYPIARRRRRAHGALAHDPGGPVERRRPARPGEYVISQPNGVGIDIAQGRADRRQAFLTTVRQLGNDHLAATIRNNEVHDTFIQNDPLDGRTYLYNAAGFATGFYVYDITDPIAIQAGGRVGPDARVRPRTGTRTRSTSTHSQQAALRDDAGRDAAQIELASGLPRCPRRTTAAGCGNVVGNGDKLGPLWIVDATDFSKLGPATTISGEGGDDTRRGLREEVEGRAAWRRGRTPPGAPAATLTFSPHNQQIVGDRIYLSHYHGGVYVLDATEAFAGRRSGPDEVGFIVPNAEPTRPLFGQPPLRPARTLLHRLPARRPEIWDAYWYKGHVLAADMAGGFYSLQWRGDRPKRRRR